MNVYEAIIDLEKNKIPGVLVTVVEKEGHGPAVTGAKMLYKKGGETTGTVGGGALEHNAKEKAEEVLNNQQNILINYILNTDNTVSVGEQTGMLCGGGVKLFYEYIGVQPTVFIFGAGHVGQQIVHYLKPLNVSITVWDRREEVLAKIDYFEKTSEDLKTMVSRIGEDDFVVIATHSHDLDWEITQQLFSTNNLPIYAGLIASKKKAGTIYDRLKESGADEQMFKHFYCPIGLETGGAAPADIGLSIVAEINAVRHEKMRNFHMRRKIIESAT